jgi:uncharacterized protein YkwD
MFFAAVAVADTGMLAAINAERKAKGRAALSYDTRLAAAAEVHAKDMARHGFMSHTGSDGSDVGKRMSRAGYKFCFGAENVAFGQGSFPAVMTAWMNSSGHRQNILHRKAKAVGVARATGDRWVMVLAAPC